jgi:predicted flap endonuclease-1-like 5' DNA nuclease
MKKESSTRRRRLLPVGVVGLLLGAGVAYAFVQWRKAVMPSIQLESEPESPSIYAVSGDGTDDWRRESAGNGGPQTEAVHVGEGAATADEQAYAPEVDAFDTEDIAAALWGDVPAIAPATAPSADAGVAEPAQAEPAREEAGDRAAGEDGGGAGPDSGGDAGDAPVREAAPVREDAPVHEDALEAGADVDVDQRERPRRHNLEEIEGIGPVYAKILADLGFLTTDDLLLAGADPKSREGLIEATGISGKLVMRWINQADLFRVKGVGEQYADLLEAAGVDTVPDLAQRRADNLTRKMAEVNDLKNLVRRIPTEGQVAAWIEFARTLPRVVTY